MLKSYLRNLQLASHLDVLMTIMKVIERFSEYDSELNLHGENSFIYLVEITEGLDLLEELQRHPNT